MLAAAEVRRNAAQGLPRGDVLRDPAVPRLAVGARQGRLLGPVLRRVRRDEHGRVHAHRLVVEDAVDVGRRAAGGRLDADVHQRGDVAHRLVDVGRVRALPEPEDRVQRRPDRLDPVRARAGRPGVARTTAGGAASPTRCCGRRRSTTSSTSTAASSTTRTGCNNIDAVGATTSPSRPTTRTPTRRGRTRRRSRRRS